MNFKTRKQIVLATSILVLILGSQISSLGQGRHEKREKKLEESAKPTSVSGGVTFQANVSYDKAYDTVLNYLKRQDYTIDSASKETGQIVTAITITGGYSQTGTRVYVTLIKDNETSTTLKVAVSEQKRKKLLQTEPWGDPKVNSEKSSKLADDIKTALQSS
jgi:ABC-type Na+ efflux pump permease subunit